MIISVFINILTVPHLRLHWMLPFLSLDAGNMMIGRLSIEAIRVVTLKDLYRFDSYLPLGRLLCSPVLFLAFV